MTIWGRYEGHKPEKIDNIPKHDVQRCLGEYMLAFGAMRGQHAYKKWKLWIGRMKDEPSDHDYYGEPC
jgi:hypothetical protein